MRWRRRAHDIHDEAIALTLAARDPRVGWLARGIVLFVIAYAISPVDLIPDFVPILGYADDLLIVLLGVLLARRLIPATVLEECRLRVQSGESVAVSRRAALTVTGTWLAAAILVGFLVWQLLS